MNITTTLNREQNSIKVFTDWKKLTSIGVCFYISACLLLVGFILWFNNGHFTYTHDDPYIHLSLARNIMHGHYGINTDEFSAPSSSILWPFLLAPFTFLPFSDITPLIFNIIFSIANIAVISEMIVYSITDNSAKKLMTQTAILLFIIIAVNSFGLTFAGLEHTAQIFGTLLILRGLIYEQKTTKIPWWLLVSIIITPLVRYECLSISGITIIYLFWRKHYMASATASFIIIFLIGSFSLMLFSNNVGLLPSSILAKSNIDNLDVFQRILTKTSIIPKTQIGLVLGFITISLFMSSGKYRNIVTIFTLSSIAQFILGDFANYPRYEMYILTAMLCLFVIIHKDIIKYISNKLLSATFFLMLIIFCPIVNLTGSTLSIYVPVASNNIYEQQYQMGRFVADFYKHPVAANDIGLISWAGKQHVLDLWGLASTEALKQRRSETPDEVWMNELTQSNDIHLIMIYPNWFESIPKNWHPIGDLHLSKQDVFISNTVRFYATDRSTFHEVQSVLPLFIATLPQEVIFNQFSYEDSAQIRINCSSNACTSSPQIP